MKEENKSKGIINQFGINQDDLKENERVKAILEAKGKVVKIIDGNTRETHENPYLSIRDENIDLKRYGLNHVHEQMYPTPSWLDVMRDINTPLASSLRFGLGGSDVSKPREVKIKPMNNGFMLEVGCQSFVFESFSNMSSMLEKYYEDPEGIEKLFHEGKLFGK